MWFDKKNSCCKRDNRPEIDWSKVGVLTLASAAIATYLTLKYRRRHSVPKLANPVTPFDVEQYMGEWYVMARLNRCGRTRIHSTTEYTLMEDGRVSVVDSDYCPIKEQWAHKEGVLQFVGDPDVAAMEVSYVGPLFTGYNVVAIEGDYEYALVVGRDTKRCMILSRKPELPEEVRATFVLEAKRIGISVNDLEWVDHKSEVE